MTTPVFNEAKATQVASMLLQLRGGKMHYLKLIKLLYFIDREALIRWGRSVTTDRHVSMDKGPVVSRIYELICDESAPDENRIWRQFISEPADWQVELKAEPSVDELSRAERRLIADIFQEHGHKNRWDLVDYAHGLPEWQHPRGTSIPISPEEILRAGGKSETEIQIISQELEELAAIGR